MDECYLLSVAIPTKNRQHFAKSTVRQIYNYDKSIQIVICDNSDDDSLHNELNDIIDGQRVKYLYTKHPISVVQNYSLAAENCTGMYYCAIGDDDCVLPIIIDLVKWMQSNNIDAVKPNKKLEYWWPAPNKTGMLFINEITGSTRSMNTRNAVIELLKNGGQGYLDLDLIGSYHCIVSKRMMDEVRDITGYYYSGASPDMYSAVCLSLLEDYNCMYVDYPFTLPGVCPKSTSYDGKHGTDIGKVNEAPHFANAEDYSWDERIPYFYTAPTIWAETMMHALGDMGKKDYIDKYFNEKTLINYLYWGYISHADEIKDYLNADQIKLIDSSFRKNKKCNRLRKIIDLSLKAMKNQYYRIYGVNSIETAVNKTIKYLSKKKTPLQNIELIK